MLFRVPLCLNAIKIITMYTDMYNIYNIYSLQLFLMKLPLKYLKR